MTDERAELLKEQLKKLNKEELIDQVLTWWTAHRDLIETNQKQRQELQNTYAFIGRMAIDQGWEQPHDCG